METCLTAHFEQGIPLAWTTRGGKCNTACSTYVAFTKVDVSFVMYKRWREIAWNWYKCWYASRVKAFIEIHVLCVVCLNYPLVNAEVFVPGNLWLSAGSWAWNVWIRYTDQSDVLADTVLTNNHTQMRAPNDVCTAPINAFCSVSLIYQHSDSKNVPGTAKYVPWTGGLIHTINIDKLRW